MARSVPDCRRRALARRAGLLVLAALLAAAPVAATEPIPPAARLLAWVRDLSAPAMEGRRAGTPGAERAAAYVADVFARLGLRPAGDAGGFLRRFEIVTDVRLGPDNALEVRTAGAPPRAFAADADFRPFAGSASAEAAGPVAFAGYGIAAPALGYDDYAGLDVRGRVVLVMAGTPGADDPASPFRARRELGEVRHKVLDARERGARAVLIVEPPGRSDRLAPLRGGRSADWGIVAISIRREVADALLAPAGLALSDLHAAIDRTRRPASRPLPGVEARVRAALERPRALTANVVARLPGTDPALAGEAVVIGAHYDHLGRGGPESLAPEPGDAIHPGADDNASGTAALLGIAEAFARAGAPRRSVVFAAFGAEELGLLGSTHYVAHPAVPLDRTVAMVNLDSVGRLRNGQLYAMGVDTGQGLRALVEQAAAGLPVQLVLRGDGIGRSDHTAFALRERPVVFFFTGPHADYHRPSDTWDRVDADGLRLVATVAYRVARALANADAPPAFVAAPAAPRPAEEGRGYGPYFGIVPEFGEAGASGVRVGGVRPGSPAAQAGLRAGDVIVRFAGVTVGSLDDLVYALRGRAAGDRVDVRYVRDGVERSADAVLQERR